MDLTKLVSFARSHKNEIGGALVAGAFLGWYYLSGQQVHPFIHGFRSQPASVASGLFESIMHGSAAYLVLRGADYLKPFRPLSALKFFYYNTRRGFSNDYEKKLALLEKERACMVDDGSYTSIEAFIHFRYGRLGEAMRCMKDFARNKFFSTSTVDSLFNNAIYAGLTLINRITLLPYWLKRKDPHVRAQWIAHELQSSLTLGYRDRAAKKLSRVLEDETVPLFHRVHFADLQSVVDENASNKSWKNLVEQIMSSGEYLQPRADGIVLELSGGLAEVLKFTPGDEDSLRDSIELCEFLHNILDEQEDDVMRSIALVPWKDTYVLAYRHLDGELLSEFSLMNGKQPVLLQTMRSLGRLYSRASLPLLDSMHASNIAGVASETDLFSQSYFERAVDAPFNKDDLQSLVAMGKLLLPAAMNDMPWVMDRDGHRRNMLYSPTGRVSHFDIENRGYTLLSGELAKWFGQGSGLPNEPEAYLVRNRLLEEFRGVFNIDAKETIPNDTLERAVMAALPLKAVSYASYSADKPTRLAEANQFLQNGARALQWLNMRGDFDGTANDVLLDAYRVLNEGLCVEH